MPERRGSRFAAEALFLVALAVALALARLDVVEIAGAMLVGWLVVAVLEWAASRGEPHYGSGLPPRYHVPLASLPPPQPLEQVDRGYPEASREDAPTWIASAALRAEVLGTWPQAAVSIEEEEEVGFASPSELDADPWTVLALPTSPATELDPASPPPDRRRPRPGKPLARYTFDPLGDPPPRSRFGRRGASREAIEVEARPPSRRLPGEPR